jgi:hypothetical protein
MTDTGSTSVTINAFERTRLLATVPQGLGLTDRVRLKRLQQTLTFTDEQREALGLDTADDQKGPVELARQFEAGLELTFELTAEEAELAGQLGDHHIEVIGVDSEDWLWPDPHWYTLLDKLGRLEAALEALVDADWVPTAGPAFELIEQKGLLPDVEADLAEAA